MSPAVMLPVPFLQFKREEYIIKQKTGDHLPVEDCEDILIVIHLFLAETISCLKVSNYSSKLLILHHPSPPVFPGVSHRAPPPSSSAGPTDPSGGQPHSASRPELSVLIYISPLSLYGYIWKYFIH